MHLNNAANYLETREFSDKTIDLVSYKLFELTGETYHLSTKRQDCKYGYDLVGDESGTTVAVRIRHREYTRYYGELTIRKDVVYGGTTEAAKFNNGIMADRLFYGFEVDGRLMLWCLVDLKKLWKSLDSTFDGLPFRSNADGTGFYTVKWTYYPECVIKTDINFKAKKFSNN